MTDLIEQIRDQLYIAIRDQLYIANKISLATTYPTGSPTRDRLLNEVEATIIGDQP